MQTETKDEIIIKIPKGVYNKNIQRLIDVVEFKSIVKKSKATQKDLDKILADIKKERGALVKPLLDRVKNVKGK
jgi:hypothetical protein